MLLSCWLLEGMLLHWPRLHILCYNGGESMISAGPAVALFLVVLIHAVSKRPGMLNTCQHDKRITLL